MDRVDLQGLLARIDLNAVLDKLDIDLLLERMDINLVVLARVDIDTVLASANLDELVARLDLQAVVDLLDLDQVVAKVDVNSLERVDIDGLVQRTELGALVARGSAVWRTGLDCAQRRCGAWTGSCTGSSIASSGAGASRCRRGRRCSLAPTCRWCRESRRPPPSATSGSRVTMPVGLARSPSPSICSRLDALFPRRGRARVPPRRCG